MDNQKLENLLNLSLDATAEEREKSEALSVGYDELTQKWELIVRYHGTEQELQTRLTSLVNSGPEIDGEISQPETEEIFTTEQSGIQIDFLYGGYAVLTVPVYLVERLSEIEEIEYIEKPKRLFFSVNQGKQASCVWAVQTEAQYGMLRGRGI